MEAINAMLEESFIEYETSLDVSYTNPKMPLRKSIKENFPRLYAMLVKRANADNRVILSVIYKYLERMNVLMISQERCTFRHYRVSDEYEKYLFLTSVSILVYKKTAKEFWWKIGFTESKDDECAPKS